MNKDSNNNSSNNIEYLKQAKNLFKKLITDSKSVFYAAGRINKTLLNKAKKSYYSKDRVFVKLYKELDDKNMLYENEEKKTISRIPFSYAIYRAKKGHGSIDAIKY